MSATPLMTHLREATRAVHGEVEVLPYFQALDERRLPIECFVKHLRALGALHEALEQELATRPEARLGAVWTEAMRRFPRIQADLAWFNPMAVPDDRAARRASRGLTDQLRRRARERPLTLLGYLYVLEGSIGGAKVLAPRFGRAFGLDAHHGLAYFTWGPAVAAARWQAFCTSMNELQLETADRDALAAAACEAFAAIRQVLKALYPPPATVRPRTSSP